MTASWNPEFDPTGIEGGIDTNHVPWIAIPEAPGMRFKPLRASTESGMFSAIVRLERNAVLAGIVYLGAMDMMVLSGHMAYAEGPLSGSLEPGTWGYVPANVRIERLVAEEAVEFLANFYGPVAFLDADGHSVRSILTALDVIAAARAAGIALVPNTLAECMQPRPAARTSRADPLAMGSRNSGALVTAADEILGAGDRTAHPHFVDTRAVPWIETAELGDIALKILRVSEETGITSLIVRHNGVAGPHYHLGAADFLVLSGRIGYRAGPPEGYGPGVWFFEPAGARHDATQRIGTDDLIYTANVYGPVQFDTGRGTPIIAVQSWMQYKALADATGIRLVENVFPGDTSLLAWAPLGAAGQPS
jgi:hypothetical protein